MAEKPPRLEDQPSSLEESVSRSSGAQSLGNPHVVYGVIQTMAKTALTEPMQAQAAVEKAARILVGKDPAYTPMGGTWNTGGGLARWLRSHINNLPAGEPEAVVVNALATLVLHLWKIGPSSADASLQQRRTHALLQNWTCLMVGIEPEDAVPPLPDVSTP
jgi:hypothetical protein